MAFKVYKPVSSGRTPITDCITISSTQIYLGKIELGYEYVRIEYDTENTSIRFSEGDKSNGFKIGNNKGAYYINATRFINAGLLPRGRYMKISHLTYRQTP